MARKRVAVEVSNAATGANDADPDVAESTL